ncbi:hypothetical protein FOZ60_004136 [Perkinsus olseni]|uniref:Uncharacterized protein n=1 Tax=Perkinsus olseni TaxID=32597 RepID=A0A7J6NTR6_PEROL|nr:hypothetical protein FOZ60_004136 [Perkinsus olseni]
MVVSISFNTHVEGQKMTYRYWKLMAFKLKYHWVVITDTKDLVRPTQFSLAINNSAHFHFLSSCKGTLCYRYLVCFEETSSSCYEQLWQFVLQPTKVPYRSFHKALRFRSSREAISRVYIPILQKRGTRRAVCRYPLHQATYQTSGIIRARWYRHHDLSGFTDHNAIVYGYLSRPPELKLPHGEYSSWF